MGCRRLQFVQVVVQGGDSFLQTLTFANVSDDNARLASRV